MSKIPININHPSKDEEFRVRRGYGDFIPYVPLQDPRLLTGLLDNVRISLPALTEPSEFSVICSTYLRGIFYVLRRWPMFLGSKMSDPSSFSVHPEDSLYPELNEEGRKRWSVGQGRSVYCTGYINDVVERPSVVYVSSLSMEEWWAHRMVKTLTVIGGLHG